MRASNDAYQVRPTHFRSTTSHNLHTRRHVLVNHGVDPGVSGVCDTVLTQDALTVSEIPSGVRWYGFRPTRRSLTESLHRGCGVPHVSCLSSVKTSCRNQRATPVLCEHPAMRPFRRLDGSSNGDRHAAKETGVCDSLAVTSHNGEQGAGRWETRVVRKTRKRAKSSKYRNRSNKNNGSRTRTCHGLRSVWT